MSALKAWKQAEKACYDYLIEVTESSDGSTAFLGDDLPGDKLNVWAFQISEGPEQTQNYQRSAPACQWLANASLLGHFQHRSDALDFAGIIMNRVPPQKNDNNTGTCGMANRGLPPNVNLFEITNFPSLVSVPVLVDEDEDIEITIWALSMSFRVEFGNEQN